MKLALEKSNRGSNFVQKKFGVQTLDPSTKRRHYYFIKNIIFRAVDLKVLTITKSHFQILLVEMKVNFGFLIIANL